MKLLVQVTVQPAAQQGASTGSAIQLVVSPHDTVGSVKERLSAIEPMPFPEQDLIWGGKVLGDEERLSDCAIEDGSSVELVVRASEDAFVQQLAGLLQARALPTQELGLLYCHRYGLTVGRALQVLGRDEQLHDFLRGHGCFAVEAGLVAHVGKGAAGKRTQDGGALEPIPEGPPARAADRELRLAVRVSVALQGAREAGAAGALEVVVRASETVGGLKERASAAEMIPFPEQKLLLAGGELDDAQVLADCGVKDGSSLDLVVAASEEGFAQQLSELLQARALSVSELSLLYTTRHGAPASRALELLGCASERLPGFLRRQSRFMVEGGCVRLAVGVGTAKDAAGRNQRYLDLHREICSAAFLREVAATIDNVASAISEASFLNIRRIVKGGSVGRGTGIAGAVNAKVVLFLDGLPPTSRELWLPALLSAVAAALQVQLSGSRGIESVKVVGDVVQVCSAGALPVDLLFSPAFGSCREAIEILGADPASAVALAEERVNFIAKQPEAVKITMRLLKWWREQQRWSSARTKPSDELLELVVAYAAWHSAPADQCAAVSAALGLLAGFGSAQLMWPEALAHYSEAEVPAALLRQRPLLLDPVNPFLNVAYAEAFDAAEMITFAQSASFF
mmetsp:Transcript_12720/g.35177  ORF Transcript_12720/g.35177 Transcript_12720/m.35177 type:complete len:627 (-) Transcript_12720:125-2005(-)